MLGYIITVSKPYCKCSMEYQCKKPGLPLCDKTTCTLQVSGGFPVTKKKHFTSNNHTNQNTTCTPQVHLVQYIVLRTVVSFYVVSF